jgi:hypothetical protein
MIIHTLISKILKSSRVLSLQTNFSLPLPNYIIKGEGARV